MSSWLTFEYAEPSPVVGMSWLCLVLQRVALLFNTREIASLFWLAVGAVWLFTRSGSGADFRCLASSFLRPQIFIPILAMLAWVGLEVWVSARLPLWKETFFKPVLFWTFGLGALRDGSSCCGRPLHAGPDNVAAAEEEVAPTVSFAPDGRVQRD